MSLLNLQCDDRFHMLHCTSVFLVDLDTVRVRILSLPSQAFLSRVLMGLINRINNAVVQWKRDTQQDTYRMITGNNDRLRLKGKSIDDTETSQACVNHIAHKSGQRPAVACNCP